MLSLRKRRASDINGRGPGSIFTEGNMLLLKSLFSRGKASDAYVANFVQFVKTSLGTYFNACTQNFSSVFKLGINFYVRYVKSLQIYIVIKQWKIEKRQTRGINSKFRCCLVHGKY